MPAERLDGNVPGLPPGPVSRFSSMGAIATSIFLIATWALAASAQAVQLLDTPPVPKPTAITVFVAKKVVTMDPWPEATAIAVSDGRILSVGSLEDLKPWTGKYPTTVDRQFADKVIYPGFVEPHAHPLLAGRLYSQPLLTPLPVPNP